MSEESKAWMEKNSRCKLAAPGFEPYHKWIDYIRGTSGTLNMLICGICFEEVIISDAHRHRDKATTSQNPDTSPTNQP